MKYFKLVNKNDKEEELYLSSTKDITPEKLLSLSNVIANYEITEISESEYHEETCEDERVEEGKPDCSFASYIINVGDKLNNLQPFTAATNAFDATRRALDLTDEYGYTEVVFMPEYDEDINEVIWRSWEEV